MTSAHRRQNYYGIETVRVAGDPASHAVSRMDFLVHFLHHRAQWCPPANALAAGDEQRVVTRRAITTASRRQKNDSEKSPRRLQNIYPPAPRTSAPVVANSTTGARPDPTGPVPTGLCLVGSGRGRLVKFGYKPTRLNCCNLTKDLIRYDAIYVHSKTTVSQARNKTPEK